MDSFIEFVVSRSEVDLSVYIICALCWFLGGISNGAIGFGMTTVAVPLISMVLPIRIMSAVISLMAGSGFANLAIKYRKEVVWKRVAPLMVGILPGAWLGLNWAIELPEVPVRIFLGVFLIVFSLWKIVFKGRIRGHIHEYWGVLVGVFAAALGSVFGMAGPPVAAFGTLAGWPKDSFKATMGMFFATAKVVIIVMQLVKGMHTWTSFFLVLVSIPFLILGMKVGYLLAKKINQEMFTTIIHWCILLMGINILVRMIGKLYF